jgi:type I restriction enzyme R subunit
LLGRRQRSLDTGRNPLNPNGHTTAYLWEQVWQRDSLLEILGLS